MKGTRSTPFRETTRPPSTCGCSPRVRSGLPPRQDRASNLVGPVRDVIGPVGWRRLFLAVRHIGRKWATCTPSVPPEALTPVASEKICATRELRSFTRRVGKDLRATVVCKPSRVLRQTTVALGPSYGARSPTCAWPAGQGLHHARSTSGAGVVHSERSTTDTRRPVAARQSRSPPAALPIPESAAKGSRRTDPSASHAAEGATQAQPRSAQPDARVEVPGGGG